MELRLLGEVEIWRDGRRLDPGPAKQRCVLAVLGYALAPVPADVLIERVWGDTARRGARDALYTYITRLRRVLGDQSDVLRRTPSGYLLDIAEDTVDVGRFRRLVERSRQVGTDDERSALLTAALGLWRGDALAGLSGDWAGSVREQLGHQRLAALADRIEADLNLGRGAGLVDELRDLVEQNPLVEPFTGQLMRALYSGGRRAEALREFQALRERLADDLGTDPSPQLNQLHLMILRDGPAVNAPSGPDRTEIPHQLPPAPAVLVGRESELDTVVRKLSSESDDPTASIVAIHGPGGIGKSALALRAAHMVASHYPGGQLYVDLRGASPGLDPLTSAETLGRFLRALGIPESSIPTEPTEAATRFRSLLVGRRVLLVLDNAADVVQVRSLLPGSAECAVLVTSRLMLGTLDNATHLALPLLDPAQSVVLLDRLTPGRRLASEAALAGRLAELCGHLPLALRITAARMTSRPHLPLAAFVERLADQRRRLDQLRHDDLSVRACLQISYQALADGAEPVDQAAATAFRLLGQPDGPDISLPVAARLLDTSEQQAQDILERLVDIRLIDEVVPDRYRMHDLLRLYARELAEHTMGEADTLAALERSWRCYVATAVEAGQVLRPGFRADLVKTSLDDAVPLTSREHATRWLKAERMNLLAAASQAASAPGDAATTTIRLAHALFGFLHSSAHWADLARINELALAVARARQDQHAEGQILSDSALAAGRLGDNFRAVRLFQESLTVPRQIGDHAGKAASLHNIGNLYAVLGQQAEALPYLNAALEIHRDLGYGSGVATTLTVLAEANRDLGNLDGAISRLREGLEIYRQLHDRVGEVEVLGDLGDCYRDRQQFAQAIACYQRAVAMARAETLPARAAWNLVQEGEAHRRSGNAQRAAILCEEALSISREIRAAQEEGLALWRLGNALADLGQEDRARRHWCAALPIVGRFNPPDAAAIRKALGGT
jgi:DNA-binding SARP family transcriptional activator/tetratricopeptide (TPR) repeat protein